jgi:hypothetical protein
MFLGFFRLSILAFEVGERYVQRFVTEPGWMIFIDAASANFRLADQPSTAHAGGEKAVVVLGSMIFL